MSLDISKQLHRAGKALVNGFPGGADALGALIGKKQGVLSNEINPNCEHAKLGLEDAIRAERFANAAPLLFAHASLLGFVCHRLPPPDLFIGDVSLLEAFSRWQAANGATCDAIRSSVDPNSPGGTCITRDEVDCIAAAGERQAAEFLELLARFRQVAEPDTHPKEIAHGR